MSGSRETEEGEDVKGRHVFDHAKYMVSHHASEIGSANLTWSANRNREVGIALKGQDARTLNHQCEEDWAQGLRR
ncbi:MAG: hypothetical protein ACYDEV_14945 [Acidiferrobacter sp.]